MQKFLGKYSDLLYGVMRIVVGLLFACHGAQKIFGMFGGMDGEGATAEIASLMGLAGIIELVGGVLVLLGLFTSWAAFISSGEMAFAYFMQHAGGGFWPIENRGELAVLYCFVFLYIASRGGGKLAIGKG